MKARDVPHGFAPLARAFRAAGARARGRREDACDSGFVDCDARDVTCRSLPPTCSPGEAPSVGGFCWGPRVPVDSCNRTDALECPTMGMTYTCWLAAGHCGPYV